MKGLITEYLRINLYIEGNALTANRNPAQGFNKSLGDACKQLDLDTLRMRWSG